MPDHRGGVRRERAELLREAAGGEAHPPPASDQLDSRPRWAAASGFFAHVVQHCRGEVNDVTSTLLSLQFGAAGQGMRPGAEALMRRNPDLMMYGAALLQRRTGLKMPDLEATLSLRLR